MSPASAGPPGERAPEAVDRGVPETTEAPGLYVHVPFCARACPYCDFDFVVGRDPPVDAFLDGLEREARGRSLPERLPVATVYLGGGTPSSLGPDGLRRVLAWIDRRFDTRGAVERTVELNPEHVDAALLDALIDAGIDRVSLGVQSLTPPALAMLGRVHQAEQARAALEAAVGRGLRVSADLIVGWPGQRAAQLRDDLDGVLATGVEHVSIYALTIEPGTPWSALARRGRRALPDADAQADRLQQAATHLGEAGLEHYEVAGYARPGAHARHNLGYWTWRDYVGLGPSAASARYATDGAVGRRTNPRGLDRWRAEPQAAEQERLSPRASAAEGLWVGLRVLEGLSISGFLRRFAAVDVAWIRSRVDRQCTRGNLQWRGDRLRVAPDRWLWHDEICADLLATEEGLDDGGSASREAGRRDDPS